MRYITLTEEEQALLEDMKRKTTSKILLPRIECLLLSHQGMEVKALQELANLSPILYALHPKLPPLASNTCPSVPEIW
jgi:hypothetical protein